MALPSPDAPLDTLTTPTPVGAGRLRANLPDGWQQGRGLFGGLLTGLMARALESATVGRPLRSLTAELCAPVHPGEVDVVVQALREGSGVTTCTVTLEQDGRVQAHGVGVMGKARASDRDRVHVLAPARDDWRTLEPTPIGPPLGPDFARFFDYRLARHFPLSGGTEAATEGWVFPKNPGSTRDAAFLATCIDAWWPALYTVESVIRPMVTIAFTFQPFVRFEGLEPGAPLFSRARVMAIAEGYCVEFRELWGEDGRLLALNQQTFAIIK